MFSWLRRDYTAPFYLQYLGGREFREMLERARVNYRVKGGDVEGRKFLLFLKDILTAFDKKDFAQVHATLKIAPIYRSLVGKEIKNVYKRNKHQTCQRKRYLMLLTDSDIVLLEQKTRQEYRIRRSRFPGLTEINDSLLQKYCDLLRNHKVDKAVKAIRRNADLDSITASITLSLAVKKPRK